MVSVQKLADITIRLKERSDKSVGWPLAAIKAINGEGIRYGVALLKKKVLAELKARGKLSRGKVHA